MQRSQSWSTIMEGTLQDVQVREEIIKWHNILLFDVGECRQRSRLHMSESVVERGRRAAAAGVDTAARARGGAAVPGARGSRQPPACTAPPGSHVPAAPRRAASRPPASSRAACRPAPAVLERLSRASSAPRVACLHGGDSPAGPPPDTDRVTGSRGTPITRYPHYIIYSLWHSLVWTAGTIPAIFMWNLLKRNL